MKDPIDMILKISVQRNLGATLGTFREIDIPVWTRLSQAAPQKFAENACYAYKMRQTDRDITEQEFKDFLREFAWKVYLLELRCFDRIPEPLDDLMVFELSGIEPNYCF